MNTRYLLPEELEQVGLSELVPQDCLSSLSIGISPITDILLFLERHRSTASLISESLECLDRIKVAQANGYISIVELTSYNLSKLLCDDSLFYYYCGKHVNPYELAKRIVLTVYDDQSWWDELIVEDAFYDQK